MDIDESDEEMTEAYNLDCYPYTFSPLLLFAPASYFDKGYSNYNAGKCIPTAASGILEPTHTNRTLCRAVAQFFSPVCPVNMLDNVLYERKNMLYEELLDHIVEHQMLVVCCIDAHFTAFQVLKKGNKGTLLYYDPLQSSLTYVPADGFRQLAVYLLLKCGYADSQHIQENKDHYTGIQSNPVRRCIYSTWRKIHTTEPSSALYAVQSKKVSLDLDRYVVVNDPTTCRKMSTQQTSNTCYFQSFLFAVLAKVGGVVMENPSGNTHVVHVPHVAQLEETMIALSRFLLEFFATQNRTLRPLTNSNVILDFYRYEASPYFHIFTRYLERLKQPVPDYEQQYHALQDYFQSTKCLHTYGKFSLDGAMTSTPNTKSLQSVTGTDGAVYKLARSHYYKYRAANLMFGFNANILAALETFCEFNALRKNQLLRFYEELRPLVEGCGTLIDKAGAKYRNKYRDYCKYPFEFDDWIRCL